MSQTPLIYNQTLTSNESNFFKRIDTRKIMKMKTKATVREKKIYRRDENESFAKTKQTHFRNIQNYWLLQYFLEKESDSTSENNETRTDRCECKTILHYSPIISLIFSVFIFILNFSIISLIISLDSRSVSRNKQIFEIKSKKCSFSFLDCVSLTDFENQSWKRIRILPEYCLWFRITLSNHWFCFPKSLYFYNWNSNQMKRWRSYYTHWMRNSRL